MMNKNRADPCCYNYQSPLGKYGKNKYWNSRDGMLGVKAFNIDLPGLSKTELILAALGEEDITKLLVLESNKFYGLMKTQTCYAIITGNPPVIADAGPGRVGDSPLG
ncbi:hypothetical protein M0657_010406 [Pyricularia oryzae]|nr:hypothetical protein M0657_010406 [Pyricularia oryzae]KAI7929708.1 hypothetical protein M9X92_001166 [Pyricularia oryzae]